MYKKIYEVGNKRKTGKENTHIIHLWTDDGYEKIEWNNYAYKECREEEAEFKGLKGEPLRRTHDWNRKTPKLHFGDISAHQKYLIERYGINDEPSKTCKEVFFDIECEMGGALTTQYISEAPKPVTSIAWYDKQADQWAIVILDKKGQLKHTKAKNKEIIPFKHEADLLDCFLSRMEEIEPDMLIGYNSDYFDIPYLYYRMCLVLGEKQSKRLSPIGIIKCKKGYNDEKGKITWDGNKYFHKKDMFIDIAGVESMDYMRLHRKYNWEDEPSWKLDAIGEKYVGINKIEYKGTLDTLFERDIHKFIEYNFVDVKILVELDKKLQYLALTRNLAHKGKIKYHEVYASSKIHDGAISAYLLSEGIVPPGRPKGETKKNYAGGFLYCPDIGLHEYLFDEDLTSLYPSIIMSLNIGRETIAGKIVNFEPQKWISPYLDSSDRNNHLGYDDLKLLEPNTEIQVMNPNNFNDIKITSVSNLLTLIEKNNLSVSSNGTFFRTDKPSVLSTILDKWFNERKKYKDKMKESYQAKDTEKGEYYHLMQYTMKILLNSLYGATALPSFRYSLPMSILSEAITLTGHRIIQESALFVNTHMNKVIRGEIELKL